MDKNQVSDKVLAYVTIWTLVNVQDESLFVSASQWGWKYYAEAKEEQNIQSPYLNIVSCLKPSQFN